jgi:hypothetical protein
VADVVRERLKVAGEETITTERLKDALELALDSSKRYMCEHCRRPNRVPMPDFSAIEKILNQMYGPLAAPEQVVNHNVLVTAMSLDEKARYLEELRVRRESLTVSSGDEAA